MSPDAISNSLFDWQTHKGKFKGESSSLSEVTWELIACTVNFHPAGMSLLQIKMNSNVTMCGKESKRIMFFSGIAEHDNEGRVITAEFKEFYLVASCE